MIGYTALGFALFLTIISVFFYFSSFFIQNNKVASGKASAKELKEMSGLADKGRKTYILSAAGIALAAAFLMTIILTGRFEYAYVFGYSSLDLPFAYKIAVFWAGQEGSFLLWLFFQSVFGLIMLKERAQAGAMAIYGLLQTGLLSLLIYKSPFMMLLETKPDGMGLNPLLQDPWMVIHPPVLFLGYAGLAVPFAYVLESIISKDSANPLNLNNVLKWSLFSFATLGAGMFIGGYWAYKVLGWGGYWAWDPVENSSLVPWLAAGAFIHLLILARVRPAALKPCYSAAIFSLVLVLYGTYLTRSGILSDFSTHSFANEGIGGYLGLFTLLVAVCSFSILIFKWQSLPDGDIYPSLGSREFLLAFGALALAVLGVLVFVGMSVPLVTMSLGNPSSVGASFYNSTSLPVALVISFLLAFAPLVKWKGNENPAEKIRAAIFLFVLPGIGLALFLKLWNPFYVLIIGFSFLALSTSLYSLYSRSISKAAALSHAGVAVLLIGIIASSAAAKTETISFEAGNPVDVFAKQITYLGTEETPDGKGFYQSFAIRDVDGGSERIVKPLTKLNKKNVEAAREPGIYRSITEDIYIAPVHTHDDEDFGEEITLSKAETVVNGGVSLKFNEFKIFGSDTVGMIMEVSLEVKENTGGKTEEINPRLINKSGSITGDAATVFDRYNITLVGVNPRENKIIVGVKDTTLAHTEILKAEIVTKPLINLVWLGAVMITVGGALGPFCRKWR